MTAYEVVGFTLCALSLAWLAGATFDYLRSS